MEIYKQEVGRRRRGGGYTQEIPTVMTNRVVSSPGATSMRGHSVPEFLVRSLVVNQAWEGRRLTVAELCGDS